MTWYDLNICGVLRELFIVAFLDMQGTAGVVQTSVHDSSDYFVFTAIVSSANYEKCFLPILFPLENVRSHAAFKLLHDISMEILMTPDTISMQVMRVLMVT